MPPGAVVLSQLRQTAPQRGSDGPPPDLLDTIASSFIAARADTTGVVEQQQTEAYMEIAKEIERLGGPKAQGFVNPSTGTVTPQNVWQAMEQYREQGHFSGLPATLNEFEEQWRAAERKRIEFAEQEAARGNIVAGFVGGMAGAMTDPVNLYTLPVGGAGKTIAQRLVSEAVANMAVEAALQPVAQRNREELGRRDLTLGEAALNVAFAGAGAAVLRGGLELAPRMKSASQNVQERAWATILDRTPGLRERVGAKIDWDALDPHLAEIAEATIPRARMTDAESGAINAVKRDASFDASNPFVPDGAGVASHNALLSDTMRGILRDSPVYVSDLRGSAAVRLRSGSGVASGVTGNAMQTVKARIGIVESGGNASARNPRSSAMGLYQFTDGTWLAYYKNRFGSDGLSDAQIVALKSDTQLQNTLMDDLLGDNAQALRDAGFAADPGNLYLAHFAGRQRAAALLRADPATPVETVLGAKAVKANPFLKGMTAGETVQWAHRKIGSVAPRAPDRSRVDNLDREIGEVEAAIERMSAEARSRITGVGEAVDDIEPEAFPAFDQTPVARRADGDQIAADARPRATPQSDAESLGLTSEARAIIPELQRIAEVERSVSLNRSAELSSRLGVDERNLAAALQQMAIDGLVVRSAKGTYSRVPRVKDGPEDIFAFIAGRGGLADKEGHDLSTVFEVPRTVRWQRAPDANGQGGIRLAEPYTTTRPALIPGKGPLVRREAGLSVDAMGEALWEAGYFGSPSAVARPTTSEVIELLQNAWASGRKIYSVDDQALVADFETSRASSVPRSDNPFRSEFQSEEHFDWEFRRFDHVADQRFGLELDDEAFAAAWREYEAAGDGDVAGAVLRMVQREIEDVQALEIADRGLDDAADILEEWEAAFLADSRDRGAQGARAGSEPTNARADGEVGPASAREQPGPIEPERWQAWDEPDSPAVKATSDSLEHDLRLTGDGLAEDDIGFRISEEGDAQSAADLLSEFDEDAAFLKTVRDCL